MARTQAQKRAQEKYDKAVMRTISIRLHKVNDADLIEVLDRSPNKQLLIKTALREYAGTSPRGKFKPLIRREG